MLSILHASRHHRKLRMRSWCTKLCIFSSVFSICCTTYQHMLLMKRQLRVLSLIPALICLHGVRAPSDAQSAVSCIDQVKPPCFARHNLWITFRGFLFQPKCLNKNSTVYSFFLNKLLINCYLIVDPVARVFLTHSLCRLLYVARWSERFLNQAPSTFN